MSLILKSPISIIKTSSALRPGLCGSIGFLQLKDHVREKPKQNSAASLEENTGYMWETDQTLRWFKSWWHDKHTSDLSPSPWFSLLVNSFVSSSKWVPKEASFFLSCKYSMYRMQFIQHPGYREETNLQWPKFKGLLSHPDNCSQHCWLVNHVAHDLKYQPVVGFKS